MAMAGIPLAFVEVRARVGGEEVTWDGEATSDTGGRATLAPAEAGASAQAVIARQTIIVRSPCR